MQIPGYAGSILRIDLTSGSVKKEPLPLELVRRFIGGFGINSKLAYDLIPADAAPLSSENLIIVGAGPFAGTLVPGAGKVLVTTRFPINGAFATASGGGSFALMLKSAGYDHLVISGRAERPVYLKIGNGNVELCDAADLWGTDSFETIDALRTRHEPCSVIPIGQAGENLVKCSISCVDKAGTVGRGGLPAVMASKNLKALVAEQDKAEIRVAHSLRLQRLVNTLLGRITMWPGRQPLVDNGIMPTAPDVTQIRKQTRKALACPGCPLADKERIKLEEQEYRRSVTYMAHLGPFEYSYGSSVEQYMQTVKFIDAANRYGIDVYAFNHLMSLMIRLYQEGILSREETDGIELKGDIDTALKLVRMTALREGLGDALADGIAGAAQRIGRGAEQQVIHIKGHGIVLEPRTSSLGTMEFEQIVNPRGAHIAPGGSPSYAPGRPPSDFVRHGQRMGVPREALERIVGQDSFNVGRLTRYSEDWYSLFSCLSLCNRAHVNRFYDAATIAELYSALTGIEVTPAELMEASERAWVVQKLLNVRAGFSRKDDRPPEAWFKPLHIGGMEYALTDYYRTKILNSEDVDRLLDEYYEERGYDKHSGTPTLAKLKELRLET